jgi:hypothetical protein
LDTRGFGDNAGYDAVALAQLDNFAGLKPGEELAGVSELAGVYARHDHNVTQNVAHCQECGTLPDQATLAAESLMTPKNLKFSGDRRDEIRGLKLFVREIDAKAT